MNDRSLRVAFLLLAAAALCGVLCQRGSLSSLNAENKKLRDATREAQRLTRVHAEIGRLREEAGEIETLRNETTELHRLRNEVRQLRDQKPEVERLRAENERLRAKAKSGQRPPGSVLPEANMIARDALTDAGLGTPEAAIQTFLWAIRERSTRRIRACFSNDAAAKLRDQSDEEVLAGAGGVMDTFKGFQIIAKKVVSADEVKLGIRITAEDSPPPEAALVFKRAGNEWKLDSGF